MFCAFRSVVPMDIAICFKWIILLSAITSCVRSQERESSPLLLYTDRYSDRKSYFRCVSEPEDAHKAMSIILEKYATIEDLRRYYVPDRGSSALNCNFEAGLCDYGVENWRYLNNLNYLPFLMNDERWEDLKEFTFEDSFEYTGVELDTTTLSFSVRAESGVHVALCDSKKIVRYETSCYWFIIDGGGRGSSFSALRKCEENIVAKGYPDGECPSYLKKQNAKLIKKSVWNSFKINVQKARNNKLFLSLDAYPDRQIFEHEDDDDPIDFRYVLVKTADDFKSIWKFHNTHYLVTSNENAKITKFPVHLTESELCISLFVYLCRSCAIRVTVRSRSDERRHLIRPKQERVWYREKFIIDHTFHRHDDIQIEFATLLTAHEETKSWAIDEIRECTNNEIKIIETTESAYSSSTCQFVGNDDGTKLTSDRKSYECISGYFGETCLGRCSDIMGNDFQLCNNTVICSTKQCYCPSGFYGKYCNEECEDYFKAPPCDFSCNTDCTQCNRFNKTCDECKVGFELPACDKISALILGTYPAVTEIGFDFLEVRLNLNSHFVEQSRIKDHFTHYRIQYKRSSEEEWISTLSTYRLHQNDNIKIDSLSFGTLYTIRAIFCRINLQCYTGENVRVIEQSTKCEDINIDSVTDQLNEAEDTTKVIISIQETHLTCPKDRYSLFVNGTDVYFESSRITFNTLPYTTIQITLQNKNGKLIYDATYITSEGKSSEVTNVKYTPKETAIYLNWDPPEKRNGHILGYIVEYQLQAFKGCTEQSLSDKQHQFNTSSLSYTIQDLKPFARYKIELTPYSKTKIGQSKRVFVDTLSSEMATERLSNASVVTGDLLTDEMSSMYVTLRWSLPSDCQQIQGVIHYDIVITGQSVWNNRTIEEARDQATTHTIKDLEPFTNYTALVFMKRPGGTRNERPALEFNFTTKSSNPPAVPIIHAYGQSDNAIYLRWKQPFPPCGILENYLMIIDSKGLHQKPKEYKVEANQICELWNEYWCYGITNLVSNSNYQVQIKAKNVDTNYGKTNTTNVRTQLKKPSRPENVFGHFDIENKILNIIWEHPFYNSPIYSFKCLFCEVMSDTNPCFTVPHPVMDKNSPTLITKKSYTIKFSAAKYATTYKISIRGFNIYEGDEASFLFETNPPIPSFQHSPSVKTHSNTTVSITIPPLSTEYKYNNTTLLITTNIQDTLKETKTYTSRIMRMYGITNFDVDSFRIAAEIMPEYKEINFVLGNVSSEHPYNEPIDLTKNINITFILASMYKNKSSYNSYSIHKEPNDNWINNRPGVKEPEGGKPELFALLLLLLIPIIIFIIVFKKRANLKKRDSNTQTLQIHDFADSLRNSNTASKSTKKQLVQLPSKAIDNVKLKPRRDLPAYELIDNKKVIVDEPNISTTSIKISDLKEYVRTALTQNELERQHKTFPKGKTKPWEYGIKPENKTKNRYGNLIAYDETRVVLNKLPNDPHSDYINANYIDGYRTKKAYIATQGPKEKTLNDFWRMVWQENSKYIVMLCNVIENEKKKCEEYWPPINENRKFGEINVYHVNSQVYADYICRTFKVKCKEQSRTVLQFHFISWPDHGIPLYPKSLVPLLKRIVVIPPEPPIIVHCSAGVGRTGTVLLCDICLRMAAHEGAVDIVRYQKLLREQRPNMVDNADQFRLVHLILIECLLIEPTSIICDDNLEYKISELISSHGIKKQMDIIEEFSWMDYVMRPKTNTDTNQSSKNRFNDTVPDGFARVFLSRFPLDDEFSDYINAVHVDGFRQKDQFIVTQQPLPNTLGDFWRMIAEKGVHVIVSLNSFNIDDETLIPMYPENKSTFSPVPYLKLKIADIVDYNFYKLTTVVLLNTTADNSNGTKEIINIIEINDWPSESIVPTHKVADLIDLWENVNKMVKDKNPICVTCYDGVTASGLFVTLAFVIEKIKLEQDCDVCLAVRTVRHNRQKFMNKMEQFEYIYRAAIIYVQSFQLYSNFKVNQK